MRCNVFLMWFQKVHFTFHLERRVLRLLLWLSFRNCDKINVSFVDFGTHCVIVSFSISCFYIFSVTPFRYSIPFLGSFLLACLIWCFGAWWWNFGLFVHMFVLVVVLWVWRGPCAPFAASWWWVRSPFFRMYRSVESVHSCVFNTIILPFFSDFWWPPSFKIFPLTFAIMCNSLSRSWRGEWSASMLVLVYVFNFFSLACVPEVVAFRLFEMFARLGGDAVMHSTHLCSFGE